MSTHKHIRSSVANKRPAASGLADGQLGINTASGTPGLYFKDTASGIVKVGPAHVGSTAPNASPAGSAGNAIGEFWVDNSLTTQGLKYYTGATFYNLTPSGTTSVPGLVELATSAETQTGTDPDRAVTPSALQSKLSDSTSTASSTTIASSTAVKSAYDLANAALPKSGGTVTGEIVIGTSGALSFEGSVDDSFETTLAVVNPTADRTITLPNTTGTVITTGDTGSVTSTMIADGTIVDGDINASASIALSKLATGALPSAITVNSSNIVDGSIVNADVSASAAIAGSKISPDFGNQTIQTTGIVSHAAGSAGAPTITFTGDTNTGIYSPGADQIGISTNGAGRLFVDASGGIGIGTTSPNATLHVAGPARIGANDTSDAELQIGAGATGNRNAYIDLVGDTTYTDYGLRLLRANSGTNGDSFLTHRGTGTLYLKCEDGGSIGFGTNNTERMRIDSSGRLGLGTSSPGAGLHVANTSIWAGATTASASGVIAMYGDGNNGTIEAFAGNNSSTKRNVCLAPYGGNVGISTTSPGRPLEVNGIIRTTATGTTSDAAQAFEIINSNAGADARVLIFSGTNNGSAIIRNASTTAGGIHFHIQGGEVARIDSSGRLLVGTSSIVIGSPQTIVEKTSSDIDLFRVQCGAAESSGNIAGLSFGHGANGARPKTAIGAVATGSFGLSDLVFYVDSVADNNSVSSSDEKMRIDTSGRLLVGTSTDSGGALLQVNGNRIRVGTAKTPASATDTGTAGEICWDANYIYVCTATNTWKRTAIATW